MVHRAEGAGHAGGTGRDRGGAEVHLSDARDALFSPVRAGNAFEETVERLLQAIRLGLVGPGDRLPTERELAARFQVSRVTLREAVRALQQAGFIESRRGRYGGTFVASTLPLPSRRSPRTMARKMGDTLDDALTMRHVLEAGMAEAAALRLRSSQEERARQAGQGKDTGGDEQHLRQRLAETAAAGNADYRRHDSRLHLALAEVAGSPSLTSAVAEIRMRINELLDAIPLLDRNIRHSNGQHAEIVAAVLSGDAETARRAMSQHLSATASLLRGFLK
jgi:DNA-binding FadR family transcriptional regulator